MLIFVYKSLASEQTCRKAANRSRQWLCSKYAQKLVVGTVRSGVTCRTHTADVFTACFYILFAAVLCCRELCYKVYGDGIGNRLVL